MNLRASLRRIRSVSASAQRHVGLRVRQFPRPLAKLQERILHGRLVDHVADPGVPSRVDLRRIELFILVVDPSGPQWQIFFQVLKVLVSVSVCADEDTGFRVACARCERTAAAPETRAAAGPAVPHLPMYCIWWPYSLNPILRRFRNVRRMVDMAAARVSQCCSRTVCSECGWELNTMAGSFAVV